jgi:hypothetical protein
MLIELHWFQCSGRVHAGRGNQLATVGETLVGKFSERMALSSLRCVVDEVKRGAMKMFTEAVYRIAKYHGRFGVGVEELVKLMNETREKSRSSNTFEKHKLVVKVRPVRLANALVPI